MVFCAKNKEVPISKITPFSKSKFNLLFCLFLCGFFSISSAFSAFWKKKNVQSDPAPSAPLEQKQRVRVALGSAPRSLDPRQATDANSQRLTDLLFDPLVRLSPDLKAEPALAEKWIYKNKTYTFFISPHWAFSHGRKITKKDLLFSFEEYKKGPFASSLEVVKSVTVEENKDYLVLKIQLKKESAKFLRADLPIFKILPHDLASLPDFHKKPVGTGPFKLKSQSSNQLVFSLWVPPRPSGPFPYKRSKRKGQPIKSAGFFYSVPISPYLEPQTERAYSSIKEVVFKIVRDDVTRFQKMLNGEIDVAQSEIPFSKVSYFFKQRDRFQVLLGPGLSTTYLLLNFRDQCLKQKAMRQFLNHSLFREEIIQYKLKNMAQVAKTILNPKDPFFNSHLQYAPYDPQKAQKIFQNLPKNCQQKTFSLKSSHARSAVDHGNQLSLQLKKTGLKVKRESYEWGRFLSDLNEGRFQMALLKWVGVMDPDIYRVAFHSKEQAPRGRNRSFYKNAHLDKLLEQGISTMNLAQRKAIYYEVQEILQKDLAFIPLWHEDQVAILRNNIEFYRLSRGGDFRYLLNIQKKY